MENICQPLNVLNFSKISERACINRATEGSAGLDLCACIDSSININPGDLVKIPCGIAISIQKGYAAFLFSRSGLAVKHGITLANSVGVIDSDYRGEICAGLCNIGKKTYTINPGERIAQLVIMKIEIPEIVQLKFLDKTDRNTGGFGSTGK